MPVYAYGSGPAPQVLEIPEPRLHVYAYGPIDWGPLDAPVPYEALTLDAIAKALANTCRYGGHVGEFYSVAEHSLHLSRRFDGVARPMEYAWALLHDAAEAFLGDIPRPLKDRLWLQWEGETVSYATVERMLLRQIADVYELAWPIPVDVFLMDDRLLATEQRAFGLAEPIDAEPLEGVFFDYDEPEDAYDAFREALSVVEA